MGDMADDAAFYAAVYEDQLEQEYYKRRKIEQKKANDVYEYHIDSLGKKHRIADMKDDHLINCYKFFRKNYEYQKAFVFFIEIRLRYPNMWRDKIGDVE